MCYLIVRASPPVRITIASAAHPPPLVLRSDGQLEELSCPGMLLGLDRGATFETRRLTVGSGDRLVVYTEGFSEARNHDGEFFGEGPLQRLLAANLARVAVEEIAARIMETVEEFSAGNVSDDQALLIAGP